MGTLRTELLVQLALALAAELVTILPQLVAEHAGLAKTRLLLTAPARATLVPSTRVLRTVEYVLLDQPGTMQRKPVKPAQILCVQSVISPVATAANHAVMATL